MDPASVNEIIEDLKEKNIENALMIDEIKIRFTKKRDFRNNFR